MEKYSEAADDSVVNDNEVADDSMINSDDCDNETWQCVPLT